MSNCNCKVEAKPCAIPIEVPPERAQVLYLEEAEAARTAAQNAANVSTNAKDVAVEKAQYVDRIVEAGIPLTDNLRVVDGKLCVVFDS